MTTLTLKGIKKRYGNVEILQHIDLDIRSGEFIVFVGPSGCGKSTLLRVIAGLEDITAGTLSIDGEVVNDRTPKERGIAMVFQSYALYPHMTVYQNMAFGLTLDKGTPKSEIDVRVRRAAEALQLTPYLERLPKALSGGQRQRVAIGRAITRDPRVFLFDEPLSNLDAALRVQTRIEIARLHEQMPSTTMIYVTHDQVEAMTLADRIVVLNGGRVEQVGSPLELYDDPDNLFVARFLGSPAMNILPAIAREGRLDLPGAQGERPLSAPPGIQGALHLGVRPEHLHLVPAGQGILSGIVTLTEQLGELTLVYLDLGNGGEPLVAKVAGKAELYPGQQVQLTSAPEHLRYFDAEGRALRQHRHSAVA